MRNITSLGQARDYGDRLSKLLKKYRELANFRLTQGDLATRVGVSARSIRDWESGINLPTARNLKRIIEVYQELGLFTPGKEREQAEELWILRQGEDSSNTFPLFDATLLESVSSKKTVAKPDQPLPDETSTFHEQKVASIPTNLMAGNLSQQLTSFIGREKELTEISRLLSNTRLLTITGTGGAGKTRLAQEIAYSLQETASDNYPEGIWWVELTPLTEPQQVVQAVISTLMPERRQEGDLYEPLKNFLQSKKLLLVLDNCEHLIETVAGLVRKLLKDCSSLQVLATSRESLTLAGEKVWPLEGLNVAQTPKQPENSAAVQLFTERARDVQPSFELNPENTETVVEICRQLDGLPLAIELAAARVKGLGVEQISHRLQQNFKLLSGGRMANTPHHQTVQAMIDWSYQLLSAEEQLLLRRIAVFRGDFSLEAAEAVLGGEVGPNSESLDPNNVLILLLQLVNKSMVAVLSSETHTEARYRLLEMVRQYSQEKLEESLEAPYLSYKHLAYYTNFVDKGYPNNFFTQSTKWVARLEQENSNLRAALNWATTSTPLTLVSVPATPGELALLLSRGLGRFWYLKSYYSEGQRWLETALALEGLPEREDLKAVRAQAYYYLGQVLANQADQSIHYLTLSVALFEEISDKFFTVMALSDLGTIHFNVGNYAEAKTLLLRSLALLQENEDRFFLGYILLSLGRGATVQGDFDEALAFLRESEAIHRQHNDDSAIAVTLFHLSVLNRLKQNLPQALSNAMESLNVFREIDSKGGIASALNELSVIQRKLQNYGEALLLAEESKAICEEEGYFSDLPYVYNNLALIKIEQGNLAEARWYVRKSLEVRHENSIKLGILDGLQTFALLAATQEQWEEFTWLYAAAETLRQQLSISQVYMNEQINLDRLNEQVALHLDEDTIDRLTIKGQTDSLDEIVKQVLL